MALPLYGFRFGGRGGGEDAPRRAVLDTSASLLERDAADAPTDSEVLTRIAEGNEQAFALAWERYHQRIAAYVYRHHRAVDVVDDILQQTFATLWERRHTIAAHPSLAGYLFTVARNRLSHLHEHERVARAYATHAVTDAAVSPPVAQNLGALAVEAEDVARRIDQVLDTLPPRTREIMRLRQTAGLTPGEIALVLGITPQVVYNQLARAVKALAEALGLHE